MITAPTERSELRCIIAAADRQQRGMIGRAELDAWAGNPRSAPAGCRWPRPVPRPNSRTGGRFVTWGEGCHVSGRTIGAATTPLNGAGDSHSFSFLRGGGLRHRSRLSARSRIRRALDGSVVGSTGPRPPRCAAAGPGVAARTPPSLPPAPPQRHRPEQHRPEQHRPEQEPSSTPASARAEDKQVRALRRSRGASGATMPQYHCGWWPTGPTGSPASILGPCRRPRPCIRRRRSRRDSLSRGTSL